MRSTFLIILTFLAVTALDASEPSWWQFLGPQGTGLASSSNLPLKWSDQEGIAWKTAIHGRGWSSPVIHADQIWMTTSSADGTQLFAICVDLAKGEILHDQKIFDVSNPQKISDANTYATPTPVVEGDRVFIHFGTYGTACLNSATADIIWSRRDLKCDHETNAGPASSPTIIGDNLVFHVDGRDVQYIIALSKIDGRTVWKTKRSFDYSDVPVNQRKAYSMPALVETEAGKQMVSTTAQGVYSYDLNGKERWRVRHKGWSVFPRPIGGHGLVFTIVDRDYPELWAIRDDGKGDITDTHVAWKVTRGMPSRCTPLLIKDLLYVVNHEGIMTCLEAKTGEVVWKQRLPGKYSATPIYTNDRIYLFNETSHCTIIRPGRKFQTVSESSLNPQQLMATPAVDGNAFIVRTAGFLYRIQDGAKRKETSTAKNEFFGSWDIGRPESGGKPKFIMTLNADYSASKSHVPNATGEWKMVNGEARVVWSDGWRDIIRKEGKRFRKLAFGPGADFDSPVDNTDTANRQ
ncbi:PQQ-binding-like beta-propeller repeat protein [Rubripirellula sp.]|nr:PQQ-binding-like beta-propeller repeat protein [Rubripirellula sp.]MDB4749610.1 PQQ-binding-like beta-propeller repeat protein [Rubripirellula sp.]